LLNYVKDGWQIKAKTKTKSPPHLTPSLPSGVLGTRPKGREEYGRFAPTKGDI